MLELLFYDFLCESCAIWLCFSDAQKPGQTLVLIQGRAEFAESWLVSLGCQTENMFSWQIFRNTHLSPRPSHKSCEDSAARKAPRSSGPRATRLCFPGSCQASSSGWQESAALSTYQQFWGLEEIYCLGASLAFSLQIWVARGVVRSTVHHTEPDGGAPSSPSAVCFLLREGCKCEESAK